MLAALNVDDIRAMARRRLPRGIFEYVDHGTEDEVGLARLRRVFDGGLFHPRVLVDVSKRDLSTDLFGKRQPLPLVVAPTRGRPRLARGRDRARGLGGRHPVLHRHRLPVLVGQAPLYGTAVAGEAGAAHVLHLLRREMAGTPGQLGCASLGELDACFVSIDGSASGDETA